jgi:hypothetical protein
MYYDITVCNQVVPPDGTSRGPFSRHRHAFLKAPFVLFAESTDNYSHASIKDKPLSACIFAADLPGALSIDAIKLSRKSIDGLSTIMRSELKFSSWIE